MQLIIKYFPDITNKNIKLLIKMQKIYSFWNQKINLVSRNSFNKFYINHILHSLSIAKFILFKNKTDIIDVGTGGGFPGIPLAIIFKNCNFTLIDSKKKKIKILKIIVKKLKLKNIKLYCRRIEDVKLKFDFVLGRAVNKNIYKFYKWSNKNLKNTSIHKINNGIIYLTGNSIKNNYKFKNKKIIETKINKYFQEEYFLDKKIIYISR